MNAKHTPGPWRVGNSLSVFAPPQPYLKDGMIAATRYLGNTAERKVEHEANARLIAAAPALLAALERTLRIFEAWQHDANPDNDLTPGESADFDAATLNVEYVRAAISQAKGEQP